MTPLQHRTRRDGIRRLAREIHDAAACLNASRAAICEKTGLTAERWRALAAIDRSSFTLSISDLARQLRQSRQAVHSLARGLEKAGWIRFLPNRDDRRLLQMEITSGGKSVLSVAEDRFNMWLLTMASDLDDHELRKLVTTLRAVHGRIARARDYA
jgi:DNA-binding MarR family transcriptional regulator